MSCHVVLWCIAVGALNNIMSSQQSRLLLQRVWIGLLAKDLPFDKHEIDLRDSSGMHRAAHVNPLQCTESPSTAKHPSQQMIQSNAVHPSQSNDSSLSSHATGQYAPHERPEWVRSLNPNGKVRPSFTNPVNAAAAASAACKYRSSCVPRLACSATAIFDWRCKIERRLLKCKTSAGAHPVPSPWRPHPLRLRVYGRQRAARGTEHQKQLKIHQRPKLACRVQSCWRTNHRAAQRQASAVTFRMLRSDCESAQDLKPEPALWPTESKWLKARGRMIINGFESGFLPSFYGLLLRHILCQGCSVLPTNSAKNTSVS